MKKRIVYIVESFATGILFYLVNMTNSLKDEYDFLIIHGMREETPDDYKKFFPNNVKFIEIKTLKRKVSLNDFKALKEIKQILKKEKHDIIHLLSSKAGALGRLGIHNEKMFYTPHGYSFITTNKYRNFICKSIEIFLSKINRNCLTIASSKSEYIETIKFNKNAVYVNNGISIKDLSTYKVDKNKLSICTCGRIDYQKNPYLFNEIAKAFPNIEFVWIGDGQLRDVLTSKNIKITGYLKKDKVLKLLAKNDIFLFPSFWEGLSIVLLEAMYLENICIVSNIDGNRYVIEDNINGFLVKEKEEYIKCINDIINNKINTNKIRKNAKKEIIKNYNIEEICKNYAKIYEEN